ncbi:MAG: SMC-Scp complex subunit ScpB [Lachnospiraceae bacterium]|nr:SMC-Scp complex subunit ScpB [Lachnospiraceae bacterium]
MEDKQQELIDNDTLPSAIEAILFTLGSAVDIKRLAEVTERTEEEVMQAVSCLEDKYAKGGGVMLLHINDSLQLATKTEFYEYLVKVANAPKSYSLSDAALETLSIIAYKQPVTRLQIEHIRGVSCSHAIDKLLEYDLIEEIGRLNAPGRPLLFGTTDEFLRCFGVKSLSDLPRLNPDKEEDFRMQAEAEVRKEEFMSGGDNTVKVGI